MRRFLAFFVAAAMIALVGSACSSSGGGPVATVRPDAATISFVTKGATKNENVTRDSLLNEVGKIVANKPFATWLKQNNFAVNANISTDTKVSAIWLTQLIHQEAIDDLFASRHLTVTSAIKTSSAKDVAGIFPTADIFPAFDAKFRAVLTERQERTEAVLGSYTDTSDTAGQAFYNAHKSEFACASGKTVAHILVATQASAQAILDQLKTGASFAALAEKDSTDTQSGAQGGLLGCLTAGEFVPAFQTAAEAAPIGTPIGPVHSQFGYHVILVTKAVNSYAASRSQVLTALAQQGQSTAQAAIDALLKASKVHLDPRFGTWGFVTNSQGQGVWQVTAPTPPTPSSSREGTTTTAVSSTTLPTAAPGAQAGTP